ncbi:MAG: hypothetical protein AVDCRST_MAG56-6335, partial [uncultured Cytophagales bacterium]
WVRKRIAFLPQRHQDTKEHKVKSLIRFVSSGNPCVRAGRH